MLLKVSSAIKRPVIISWTNMFMTGVVSTPRFPTPQPSIARYVPLFTSLGKERWDKNCETP